MEYPDKYPVEYAPEKCVACLGTGNIPGHSPCPACEGIGTVMTCQPPLTCPRCKGTGQHTSGMFLLINSEFCVICRGTGWVLTL
jgi:DnaJ-class molecular chaperone